MEGCSNLFWKGEFFYGKSLNWKISTQDNQFDAMNLLFFFFALIDNVKDIIFVTPNVFDRAKLPDSWMDIFWDSSNLWTIV